MIIETGHFYFIRDDYFVDFPDPYLEKNKETVHGQSHDRPCFYAFEDQSTKIFWLIPFSSKTEKYEKIYHRKIAQYGSCDTLVFGDVLGYRKAFLLQNMCPVISKYIANEYLDNKAKIPVRVDGVLEQELIQKAKKILALARQGKKVVFPDILEIEKQLLHL